MSADFVRQADMTALQRVLYATYLAKQRQQKDLERAANRALYVLNQARRQRDTGQKWLETIYALLEEYGIAQNVSRVWPVTPSQECEDDGRGPVAQVVEPED